MSEPLVSAYDPELVVNEPPLIATAEPLLASATPRRLAVHALLLDQRAYTTVAAERSPLKKGFLTLLLILGVVILARLVGYLLGYLTSPRLDSLQTLVQNFITGLPWYAAQVQQSPGFAAQFAQGYWLSWEAVRALLGIPTPASTGLNTGALLLNTLLSWLLYSFLAHAVARWFGGLATWRQTLGVLALAYAPLLLLAVEAVPGASVPLMLLFLAMLVGKFQALKAAHHLTTGYALASVFLPYLIALTLLLALALFGGAFGLEQIPYFDTGVQTFRLFGGLLQ